MSPQWLAAIVAHQRRRRSGHAPQPPPVWQLLAGEMVWALREGLQPLKLVPAVLVALGVSVALGPATPGPIVSGGWRLGLALGLGMLGAAFAHAMLLRLRRHSAPDDPLPGLRVIAATVALLLSGVLALAYLLAVITGSAADPDGTPGQLQGGLAIDLPLFAASALLFVGLIAAGLGRRLRVPSALLFLALGMVLGQDGLGLVQVTDPVIVQSVGVAALVVILFEGGLTTSLSDLRTGTGPGLVLATVGVVITAGLTALGGIVLLGLSPRVAWLVGAVVASTDAAVVFEQLRSTPLPRRLASVLRVESGVNDPVAVLLTVGLLSSWRAPPDAGAWLAFGALQLIGGITVGVGVGWLGARLLRLELGGLGVYPMLALTLAGVSYGLAVSAGASGFLATYVTGIVVAQEVPRHRRATEAFHGALSQGVEVGLFLMLGLLVPTSQLPTVAGAGVVITAVLLLARPVAVATSLMPFGFNVRELAGVSWLGLRGAVPVVLATFAFSAGIDAAGTLYDLVFFVVALSALLQGTTAGALVHRLGLGQQLAPSARVATVPLDVAGADLVEVTLGPRSPRVHRRLAEQPLPADAVVTAMIREGRIMVPRDHTYLRPGDRLVVATTGADPVAIERWAHGGADGAAPRPGGHRDASAADRSQRRQRYGDRRE